MRDFFLWSAPSLQSLLDVELYYVHRDDARLQRALAELAPLNGQGTAGWAPLLAFVSAAKPAGYEDLHARAGDVRERGARGPGDVNCLWADFYATGDREPVLLLIAALPSWHRIERQMKARGADESNTVIQGAGHSVHWSLRPHLRRHGRLRALCKQEASALDQPLQAREELLRALADAAKYPAEGEESAPPREAPAGSFGPPPDLTFLDAAPTETWLAKLAERYPSFEAIEAAIVAAEAAGHARDAGILCATCGYYSLAARHLATTSDRLILPVHALGMALFHEALALARAGRPSGGAFEKAIAIFELRPDEIAWAGGALEARVQRAALSKDPQDAEDALARIDRAAIGPFAEPFGTLIAWARQTLSPE